ncbi:MAG: hypothetical protein R3F19_32825 [Verrucomicrobiales bacterium]
MKELPEANCGRVTDRGEAGYGKAIRRRTETSYEADGMGRAGTTQQKF